MAGLGASMQATGQRGEVIGVAAQVKLNQYLIPPAQLESRSGQQLPEARSP